MTMALLLVIPYPVHMKHSKRNDPKIWIHPPHPPWPAGGVEYGTGKGLLMGMKGNTNYIVKNY